MLYADWKDQASIVWPMPWGRAFCGKIVYKEIAQSISWTSTVEYTKRGKAIWLPPAIITCLSYSS